MRRTVRWLRGFAPGVAAGLLAAPWFWGASGPRPAEAAAGFAGPVVRVAPGERGTAGDRLDDPLPAVWYDGLAFGAVVDNLRNA
ncbi:MAG: hypothetical protein AVDCRST_MAG64-4185, partial [uncultured Phycisphaerae bacterium]